MIEKVQCIPQRSAELRYSFSPEPVYLLWANLCFVYVLILVAGVTVVALAQTRSDSDLILAAQQASTNAPLQRRCWFGRRC